ncbi:MAG: zinc ABC transporter substrate-binding protein, partial [Anaerolinea sp.]|nr:zinc ABC transporter substrate-binding protein [Anaerolinea sp.]
GDIVGVIGGDNIELTVLVGPDGDPHVYEPTPQDVAALAEADLLFENGLELEPWIDDLYTASGSSAVRVAVSEGVDVIPLMGHEHGHHEHEHQNESPVGEGEMHQGEAMTDARAHEHGEFDPHTWMSPRNVIIMVENIRAALSEADPDHAEMYAANAEAYIAQLNELDAYIREQVATIPEAHRVLITTHELFGYFARDYGFELTDSALGSITTEAADPSAAQIAAVIDEIRAFGVPAVFVENVGNPELMEQIAREAGVTLAPPLYTHGLGPAGSGAETYLNMMRYNIDVIAEALR